MAHHQNGPLVCCAHQPGRPGLHSFDADGGGETVFGAVQATLDCHWGSRSMHFTWEGGDEGDHVSGDGDAELEDDGTISGEIRFNNGDETTFTARRA